MRYQQTEYDKITPPIKRRFERMSREAGEKIIPLASGESPPAPKSKKKATTKSSKRKAKQ